MPAVEIYVLRDGTTTFLRKVDEAIVSKHSKTIRDVLASVPPKARGKYVTLSGAAPAAVDFVIQQIVNKGSKLKIKIGKLPLERAVAIYEAVETLQVEPRQAQVEGHIVACVAHAKVSPTGLRALTKVSSIVSRQARLGILRFITSADLSNVEKTTRTKNSINLQTSSASNRPCILQSTPKSLTCSNAKQTTTLSWLRRRLRRRPGKRVRRLARLRLMRLLRPVVKTASIVSVSRTAGGRKRTAYVQHLRRLWTGFCRKRSATESKTSPSRVMGAKPAARVTGVRKARKTELKVWTMVDRTGVRMDMISLPPSVRHRCMCSWLLTFWSSV